MTTAPQHRDRYVDLLRVGALGVVVLWHLVLTIPWWGTDGPHVSNIVAPHHWLWPLTWITPMPLFFIAGGWANGRALSTGTSARTFLRRRCSRLLGPALPLALTVCAAWFATGLLDNPQPARAALKLAASHLWFLGVYISVTLLAPLTHRLSTHRWWPAPFAALIALAAVGDIARFSTNNPAWAWLNMVTAWAVVHQAGYHLDQLRSRRRTAAHIAASSSAIAITLCWLGPYSWPMVGVPGAGPSNLGPATVALASVGVLQGALAAMIEPALAGATRLHTAVTRLSPWSMPVYLWHLPAYVSIIALWNLAGWPMPTTDSLFWWVTRPAIAVVALALCAALITVTGARPRNGTPTAS